MHLAILSRAPNASSIKRLVTAAKECGHEVQVMNTLRFTISRDKLRSSQMLSSHDVALPGTMFVRDRADVPPAIQEVGGAPLASNCSKAPKALASSWHQTTWPRQRSANT